ncbi:hypothetical protein [Bradyrhizobium sp. CCGUVB14]|uniref:hypothetical protein n=1 Tax=Bradyrhizobium sp. CCGUVB14 TaxID=2949628 RepID=UPI0020B403D3|nr:hypothetical protein [Bradyrhizobium sp. CCGUVB14]MCP3442564.1 hypothetical protein [Bradyrhizobium sp. CCGUVB14]
MADEVARGPRDSAEWNPSKYALWSERWGDAANAPTSILLRHPTAPFLKTVDAIVDGNMQRVGNDYLEAVVRNPRIDPPIELPDVLPTDSRDFFKPGLSSLIRWMPLGWPPANPHDDDANRDAGNPFVSFRVERKSPTGELLDQTVVLVASEWIPDPNSDLTPPGHFLGSGFGIRVIAHVRPKNGGYEVRITGMTASLPFGLYSTAAVFSLLGKDEKDKNNAFAPIFQTDRLSRVKAQMSSQLGLKNQSVSIRGARIATTPDGKSPRVQWQAASKPGTESGRTSATPYSLVFSGTPTEAGALVSRVELVADAVTPGYAWVFPIDPASQKPPTDLRKRRPTRSEEALEYYRDNEQITAHQADPLIYQSAGSIEEEVVVCPGFVLADGPPPPYPYPPPHYPNPGDPKTVNLPDTLTTPLVRSNDFSAISAYNNVRQFFHRLEAYGIDAVSYFRIARLPLKVFYRSGVRPGPGKDGQTVNARVLPEGWPVDYVGPTKLSDRPILQLHLALADLSTRARKPWDGTNRSQAEPLGIAADARWIWHEIGHVLLMCSVGELEFRFAHSAGDALAAIASDPQSQLAGDGNWRGATFPWVFTPRRHDRCISHGWSWGGTLHYAMSQVPDSTPPRRKGYWTEQILSSSLFRLYRAIGGDTKLVGLQDQPDRSARESASHYSVYLIMRGIQLLPTSTTVLTNEPDQFVSALIDADIGTILWDVNVTVTFPPPPSYSIQSFPFHRIGGCVHKVIRWAFEVQGLYAVAGTITNAPGLPPPVDIYILDRRPLSEVSPYGDIAYGPGSYNPVSLDWDLHQAGSGTPPLWQAHQSAIVVSGGNISVKVGNRGGQQATNVVVTVWWQAWPGGSPPPKWTSPVSTTWTPCDPSPGSSGQAIDSGAPPVEFDFTFNPPPSGTRYLVLAIATCVDDAANTDPTTLFPCSQLPTELIDLVPNDNNLGLIVVGP